MKVVIFAGGYGTRLSEETVTRPKPMVEVGGRPIIWHIMSMYARHGLTDFVVLGGYKVDYIRQYFLNYRSTTSDFTIDMATGEVVWAASEAEPWRVTVLDTGLNTMTGGRLKRARDVIGDERFCLTYGDGVSDVDIARLIDFHDAGESWLTVTAVQPPGRFGVMNINEESHSVTAFREKAGADVGLINGGFFVCEPQVFDLVDGDETVWEQEPLQRLVKLGKLRAYHHGGFWQSMDTLHDRMTLEAVYQGGAPWLD